MLSCFAPVLSSGGCSTIYVPNRRAPPVKLASWHNTPCCYRFTPTRPTSFSTTVSIARTLPTQNLRHFDCFPIYRVLLQRWRRRRSRGRGWSSRRRRPCRYVDSLAADTGVLCERRQARRRWQRALSGGLSDRRGFAVRGGKGQVVQVVLSCIVRRRSAREGANAMPV